MKKIMYNGKVILDIERLEQMYSREEIDALVSSLYVYKGTVALISDLDSIESKTNGDTYYVEEDGKSRAWNGVEWDVIGDTVDLSNYYNKSEINNLIKDKVNLSYVGDKNSLTTLLKDNIVNAINEINYKVENLSSSININNYLAKDNTTEYTPTEKYNPSTKDYVDTRYNEMKSYVDNLILELNSKIDSANTELSTLTDLGGE